MPRAALALGSNMGDKRATIAAALSLLQAKGVRVVARSSDYRTEPWGFTDQDWFVNACAIVETDLSPLDLLAVCLETERVFGRERDVKWGPRIIDIDIIAYEGVTCDSPILKLPHPFVLDRAFVLVPLVEIAPDLEIVGVRVREAQARLGSAGVTRLPPL